MNVLYKLKSAAGARGVSVGGAISTPFVRVGTALPLRLMRTVRILCNSGIQIHRGGEDDFPPIVDSRSTHQSGGCFSCVRIMRAINPETFYDSQRWTHIRARALRRDRYQCQMCKRYGRLVEATEVHHIEHLEDNPDRAYDLSNLISLCHRCHNKQHPEKAYAMNHGKEYRKY